MDGQCLKNFLYSGSAFLGLLTNRGGGKNTPLPKICHTYPKVMKFGTVITYLKKIKKHMNNVTNPLSSADISIFSPEISKLCYIRNANKDCILIHNF